MPPSGSCGTVNVCVWSMTPVVGRQRKSLLALPPKLSAHRDRPEPAGPDRRAPHVGRSRAIDSDQDIAYNPPKACSGDPHVAAIWVQEKPA